MLKAGPKRKPSVFFLCFLDVVGYMSEAMLVCIAKVGRGLVVLLVAHVRQKGGGGVMLWKLSSGFELRVSLLREGVGGYIVWGHG